jgi:hypothetical protein
LNRIIDWTFIILGHEIHLRINPPAFQKDLKILGERIERREWAGLREHIDSLYNRWGMDPELLRLATFADFSSFEDEFLTDEERSQESWLDKYVSRESFEKHD